MKILLIGASGYVGSALYSQLSKNNEVIGTCHKQQGAQPDLVALNLERPKDISETLQQHAPDIVIHAGGLTSVDYCERNKEEATTVNTEATRYILDHFDKKIVYISTNYVFDGLKGSYTESDSPNPVNHYGLTKVQAEKMVLRSGDNLVIRLGSVYGHNPQNNKFFNRFIENGKPKKEIDGCQELILSPTYLWDVANNFERFMLYNGIIHFTSSPPISEYDFFYEISKKSGLGFIVHPVPFDKICRIAKRPRNASLSTERELSFSKTPLDDSLKSYNQQAKNGIK